MATTTMASGDGGTEQSSGAECVQVAIRCRPLNVKEAQQGHRSIVAIDTEAGQIIVQRRDEVEEERDPGRTWAYDVVFGPDDTQEAIYRQTAKPIVDSVLQGYNGTIFAFGQTGTGKTWTMEGAMEPEEHQGIIPRAIHHLFHRIDISQNPSKTFLVTVSFIEIYNDTIRDLLSSDDDPNALLDLKEDTDRGVYVKGLENVAVENSKRIHECLLRGQRKRKVGETNMNRLSSRSHCIFRITIETSELGADGDARIRAGKLNLVDLAGSERQAKTGATGVRLQEATKINLSLSALGNVIRALTSRVQTHVPYRNSKLTRLLQDSLGGNTKTAMIANIGPAAYNFEETTSTLRFASRAKHIQNRPQVNEDPKDTQLRAFQDEIDRLKAMLQTTATTPSRQPRIIDRVVVKAGMDPVQLRAMEEERARRREAMELQAQADKELILAETSAVATRTRQKEVELKAQQSSLEVERLEREKLKAKIDGIENKLLHGNRIIDEAKRKARDLELKETDLERARMEEVRKRRLLKEKEEAQVEFAKKYDDQEIAVKKVTEKLMKVRDKYTDIKHKIGDAQGALQQEREDMLDTNRELSRQVQLRTLILDDFVAPAFVQSVHSRIEVDDDKGACSIKGIDYTVLNQNARRPIAAHPGQFRPQSEYSRIACALGNKNARFRIDNILQIELDLPERTTRDWEDSVDMFEY